MDWIKIKIKHVLFTDLTGNEYLRLQKLLAMVALNERMLTNEEIEKILPEKSLEKVEKKLEKWGKTVRKVMEKQLEDVEKVNEEKERKRKNKQQSRGKRTNVTATSPDRGEERRLEEIRLDKNNKKKEIKKKTPAPKKDFLTKDKLTQYCEVGEYHAIDFVKLTQEELDKLEKLMGKYKLQSYIQKIDNYCVNSRKGGYADYYRAVLKWYQKDQEGGN